LIAPLGLLLLLVARIEHDLRRLLPGDPKRLVRREQQDKAKTKQRTAKRKLAGKKNTKIKMQRVFAPLKFAFACFILSLRLHNAQCTL
jgi:hypothetical protein